MAATVKPRPRPRTRQGKPPTLHEGVENPNGLPMLRTSERKDFKRCPQRWSWGWREGLKPTGPPNDKLWFGTGWHLVMAHIYGKQGTARGRQPLKVWRDWLGEEIPRIRINISGVAEYREEVYVDAGKLGEEMIGNYLDEYSGDSRWHMIQVEKPFEVILVDTTGVQRVLFCGTYDGVFRDLRDDTFWLLEHKTAKSIQTSHLELDDQAGGYLTVAARELANAGLMPKGKQIKGIMYNFARKAPKDDRPVDSDGLYHNKPVKADYIEAIPGTHEKMTLPQLVALAERNRVTVLGAVSKNQPAPLFKREPITRTVRERNSIVGHMQAEVQHMELMRRGELPLYKNPTRDCSWDCNFYRLCVLHESGGPDWEEYKESVFHTEDPYADHRKSAAGDD
jgi:hypothetical protein